MGWLGATGALCRTRPGLGLPRALDILVQAIGSRGGGGGGAKLRGDRIEAPFSESSLWLQWGTRVKGEHGGWGVAVPPGRLSYNPGGGE